MTDTSRIRSSCKHFNEVLEHAFRVSDYVTLAVVLVAGERACQDRADDRPKRVARDVLS